MGIHVEEAMDTLHRVLQSGRDDELRAFLSDLQPADLAELVPHLSVTRRWQVFEAIDREVAVRTVESIEAPLQYEVLTSLPKPLALGIVELMSSDDLADLLGLLEPHQVEEILVLIPHEAEAIRGLMRYPENTAGGLMTLDAFTLRADLTVEQALQEFRRLRPESETIYYVYVKDERGRLSGVVSLRQLVVARPTQKVAEVAISNVVTIPVGMHQEEVARMFDKYDFLALPVVDTENRLLGVVTVDDVIDVLREEATEDISRMGGQEPLDAPYLSARVTQLVRKRIGWLLVLFVAQSVTGNILAFFEEALEAVIALAFFIPLLIGTAGNAGAQASTLVVRAMAVGEVTYQHFFRIVARESLVGLLLGTMMAIVTFFWSRMFGGPVEIGYTVALTIFVIIILASTVGATLPILAKRLRFDPAVASAPLITTFVDATGLIVYFTIAYRILLS